MSTCVYVESHPRGYSPRQIWAKAKSKDRHPKAYNLPLKVNFSVFMKSCVNCQKFYLVLGIFTCKPGRKISTFMLLRMKLTIFPILPNLYEPGVHSHVCLAFPESCRLSLDSPCSHELHSDFSSC